MDFYCNFVHHIIPWINKIRLIFLEICTKAGVADQTSIEVQFSDQSKSNKSLLTKVRIWESYTDQNMYLS